jgi:hypothetical protein
MRVVSRCIQTNAVATLLQVRRFSSFSPTSSLESSTDSLPPFTGIDDRHGSLSQRSVSPSFVHRLTFPLFSPPSSRADSLRCLPSEDVLRHFRLARSQDLHRFPPRHPCVALSPYPFLSFFRQVLTFFLLFQSTPVPPPPLTTRPPTPLFPSRSRAPATSLFVLLPASAYNHLRYRFRWTFSTLLRSIRRRRWGLGRRGMTDVMR